MRYASRAGQRQHREQQARTQEAINNFVRRTGRMPEKDAPAELFQIRLADGSMPVSWTFDRAAAELYCARKGITGFTLEVA